MIIFENVPKDQAGSFGKMVFYVIIFLADCRPHNGSYHTAMCLKQSVLFLGSHIRNIIYDEIFGRWEAKGVFEKANNNIFTITSARNTARKSFLCYHISKYQSFFEKKKYLHYTFIRWLLEITACYWKQKLDKIWFHNLITNTCYLFF